VTVSHSCEDRPNGISVAVPPPNVDVRVRADSIRFFGLLFPNLDGLVVGGARADRGLGESQRHLDATAESGFRVGSEGTKISAGERLHDITTDE